MFLVTSNLLADKSKRESTTIPVPRKPTIEESSLPITSASIPRKRPTLSFFDSIPGRVSLVIISLFIFVGIWQALTYAVNDPVILSGPIPVLSAFISLLLGQIPPAAAHTENLQLAMIETGEMIAVGYAFSLLGIPIGIIMGRWRAAESIIDPWVNAVYAIPMVALTPLIYPLTGGTFSAAVLVVFLISVFTIIVNVYSGVKYTSNTLAEVGKTFGASEFQFLKKIVLPASLPDIVAGMRLGLGRAVLGAFVAQVLVTTSGLGQIMMDYQMLINTPFMMATVFAIALIGIVALQSPRIIEKYFFKWKETERIKRGFKR
jgi:ABC-type nitrate/sulfonate/bicarbonate transport system permease component